MKPKIIIQLTPAEFAAKEAELKADGIALSGDNGEIKKSGVDLKYSYDGQSTLTIEVESKPWILSEASLESQIKAWFAKSEKEHAQPAPQPPAE